MLRSRVKLLMRCTNLLTWELNKYGRQTTDDGRRMTDGRRQTTHFTLASRGLEEPAHALRGLEEPFFHLCCCVSFGSGGK